MQQDVPPSGQLFTEYTLYRKQSRQRTAWDNSLFEDNAEFGMGMLLAQNAIRGGLKEKVEDVLANTQTMLLRLHCQEYLDTYNSGRYQRTGTENW